MSSRLTNIARKYQANRTETGTSFKISWMTLEVFGDTSLKKRDTSVASAHYPASRLADLHHSDDDEKHESGVHSGERGREVIVGVRIDSII